MGSKLYVGNLPYGTSDSDLSAFFEDNGFTANSVNVISDRETGRSKGFGFVELNSPDEVESAIDKLNGVELDGRALKVNVAQDKPRRDGGNRDRY